MGNLTPGVTYIYEKADGVTYAREFGSPSNKRFPIGWDSDSPYHPDVIKDLQEDKLWGEIRRAAKSNPALQNAVDRVKLLYELSKANGKE